jgi:hypothetical protein
MVGGMRSFVFWPDPKASDSLRFAQELVLGSGQNTKEVQLFFKSPSSISLGLKKNGVPVKKVRRSFLTGTPFLFREGGGFGVCGLAPISGFDVIVVWVGFLVRVIRLYI